MEVILAKNAGFCPGVKRAVDKALSCCGIPHTYTLGELIHNPPFLKQLEEKGIKSISFDEIPSTLRAIAPEEMQLILRTHGIPKDQEAALYAIATESGRLHIIDMTCPFVKKIHKIAEENTSEQTVFLHFCHKNHPEALGNMSYAKGEKYAISSIEDLKMLNLDGKIPILSSQTTENLVEFKKIKNFLKNLYTNAIFFDTICSVTEIRQEESIALAENSDGMIVIGGKNSSNTQKLFALCKEHCDETICIEAASEIPSDFPVGKQKIGITAGASTPGDIITEVLKTMEMTENNFVTMLEESIKPLHTGETVTGIVYAITDNEIYLDLGAKFTGVIVKEQITEDASAKLQDMFKVGDEVTAFVIRVEDGKGVATLSKTRVDRDRSWVVLKEAFDNGADLEGEVTAVVKGGVVMNVANNRVFVPASQTGIAKDGDMSVLVGTTQKVRLIEFDEGKKKALGSIKVILNEQKKAAEDAIWATLEVGAHYRGVVKNLVPYGAFVDIGGVDGMVHNSELSWKRIKHPSVVVSVGQEIEVFIKELDTEKRRISLGYKTQENDTWFQFTQKFNVGDIVPAKIVSLMPFGAFAEVYEDVDGLIHISRISTERVNSPADVLSVGQIVNVKITEIDDENRKLALSIRAIEEAEKKAAEAEAKAAEKAARDAERAEEEKRAAEERADMAPYIVGSI